MISLDVEEEGLFSGEYRGAGAGVDNARFLPRLLPLCRDLGYPLTLFCSWAVFNDAEAMRHVLRLRDEGSVEIGAHLHHWSTPPLEVGRDERAEPQRTHLMPREALAAKLTTLFDAGREATGERIVSFRMGRWDLKSELFPLLMGHGVENDCSIVPLRAFADGADHFLAPPEPYWVSFPDGKRLLEIPVTQIPPFAGMPRLWRKLCGNDAGKLDKFHYFGALSCNPLWHSAPFMRLAARLLAARGGQVLSFFWHSSEMAPGGSPKIRSEADQEKLLKKIYDFCAWLKENFDVEGKEARGLRDSGLNFPVHEAGGEGDWR